MAIGYQKTLGSLWVGIGVKRGKTLMGSKFNKKRKVWGHI